MVGIKRDQAEGACSHSASFLYFWRSISCASSSSTWPKWRRTTSHFRSSCACRPCVAATVHRPHAGEAQAVGGGRPGRRRRGLSLSLPHQRANLTPRIGFNQQRTGSVTMRALWVIKKCICLFASWRLMPRAMRDASRTTRDHRPTARKRAARPVIKLSNRCSTHIYSAVRPDAPREPFDYFWATSGWATQDDAI